MRRIAGGRGSNLRVRDQMPVLDAGNRPRIADDLDPARIEIDLGRLGLIDVVSTVIHRVDESLSQGRQGIADPAADLAPVRLFLQMRRGEILKVIQAAANLIHEGSAENALLLHVPGAVRGKLHDLDPGAPKPFHRLAGEEQETRVPGHLVIVDPRGDPHASVHVASVRFVEQPAVDVAQVLADLGLAKILDAGVRRPAIVPGNARRLPNEPAEHVAALLRVDGRGTDSDPVPAGPATVAGCAMRSHLAGGSPNDQKESVVHRLRRQDGRIVRVQPVAVAADPLLRLLDLRGGETGRRKYRPSVPLPHTDDDVAAVQVVVVVRERADRPQHLDTRGVGIPRRLELDALRFHAAAMQQCIEIDREDRAHRFNYRSRGTLRASSAQDGTACQADDRRPRIRLPLDPTVQQSAPFPQHRLATRPAGRARSPSRSGRPRPPRPGCAT